MKRIVLNTLSVVAVCLTLARAMAAEEKATRKSSYKGKDTSGQYRFTDAFVKRNGRWQAIATHVTRVAKR